MPNSPAIRARLQGQNIAPRIFSRWQGVVTCIDAYSASALDLALTEINNKITDVLNDSSRDAAQASSNHFLEITQKLVTDLNDITTLCAGNDELILLHESLLKLNQLTGESQVCAAIGVIGKLDALERLRQGAEYTATIREALYARPEFESFAEAAENLLQKAINESMPEIYEEYRQVTENTFEMVLNFGSESITLGKIAAALGELTTSAPMSDNELTTQVYAMLSDLQESLTEAINAAQNVEPKYLSEKELHSSLGTIFTEEYREGFRQMVEPKLSERLYDYNSALEYVCREIVGYHVGMFGIKRRAAGLKSDVNAQQRLAQEIRTCFERIVIGFKLNEPELKACGDFEIINGINDTIEIKCQSIAEAVESYAEECAEVIAVFSGSERSILEAQTDCITRVVANELFSRLSTIARNDRRGAAIVRLYIAEAELDESENAPLSGLRRALTNAFSKASTSIGKKTQHHTKDSLLFEISTFEEIMHYSVSRLRRSEEAAVAGYVALIDRQMQRIESLLVGYGITTIRPQPHDIFDGKEHEVLVAEAQEGFKKGEIIKPMNSGYKQDGVVLLRANVIAAK